MKLLTPDTRTYKFYSMYIPFMSLLSNWKTAIISFLASGDHSPHLALFLTRDFFTVILRFLNTCRPEIFRVRLSWLPIPFFILIYVLAVPTFYPTCSIFLFTFHLPPFFHCLRQQGPNPLPAPFPPSPVNKVSVDNSLFCVQVSYFPAQCGSASLSSLLDERSLLQQSRAAWSGEEVTARTAIQVSLRRTYSVKYSCHHMHRSNLFRDLHSSVYSVKAHSFTVYSAKVPK